jgi:hypothetical protein
MQISGQSTDFDFLFGSLAVTIGKSSAERARPTRFLVVQEMLMTTSWNYPAARTGQVRFDHSTQLRGLGQSGGSINETHTRSMCPLSVHFETMPESSTQTTTSTVNQSRCVSNGLAPNRGRLGGTKHSLAMQA